jgi:hypothetical protein
MFEQVTKAVFAGSQGNLRALPLDGIADGARCRIPGFLTLYQIVLGADLNGFQRELIIPQPGQNDNRYIGILCVDGLERSEPLAVGEAEIEQDRFE